MARRRRLNGQIITWSPFLTWKGEKSHIEGTIPSLPYHKTNCRQQSFSHWAMLHNRILFLGGRAGVGRGMKKDKYVHPITHFCTKAFLPFYSNKNQPLMSSWDLLIFKVPLAKIQANITSVCQFFCSIVIRLWKESRTHGPCWGGTTRIRLDKRKKRNQENKNKVGKRKPKPSAKPNKKASRKHPANSFSGKIPVYLPDISQLLLDPHSL